jgi:hypothetical protein
MNLTNIGLFSRLQAGEGGFVVGLVAGLTVFDDATNSDRKVWTAALLSAAGGAVGGYFLGRALDKRTKTTKVTSDPTGSRLKWTRSQWAAPETTRSRISFRGAEPRFLSWALTQSLSRKGPTKPLFAAMSMTSCQNKGECLPFNPPDAANLHRLRLR